MILEQLALDNQDQDNDPDYFYYSVEHEVIPRNFEI